MFVTEGAARWISARRVTLPLRKALPYETPAYREEGSEFAGALHEDLRDLPSFGLRAANDRRDPWVVVPPGKDGAFS